MNLFSMGGTHNEHYGESGITRPQAPSKPDQPAKGESSSSGGSQAAPYPSVEAALAAGVSQKEIDAYLANNAGLLMNLAFGTLAPHPAHAAH